MTAIAWLFGPVGRYLLAALAVAGLIWGYGHNRYQAGEAASEARYQAALEAQRADLERRQADARADESTLLAAVAGQRDTALEQLRTLREQPVRTVIQTREVPANGQTCPVPSITPDWRLRFNAEAAAASHQPVPAH